MFVAFGMVHSKHQAPAVRVHKAVAFSLDKGAFGRIEERARRPFGNGRCERPVAPGGAPSSTLQRPWERVNCH